MEKEIEIISTEVCNYFNIHPDMLQSKTRKREIVKPRQTVMYLSKNLTGYSLKEIGKQIGGKDHATVLSSCRTVKNLMETDKYLKSQVEAIEKILKFKLDTPKMNTLKSVMEGDKKSNKEFSFNCYRKEILDSFHRILDIKSNWLTIYSPPNPLNYLQRFKLVINILFNKC
jgi:hypothetical protein